MGFNYIYSATLNTNSGIRTSSHFDCFCFPLCCVLLGSREVGVVVKDVDLRSGEVFVNLNEELLLKRKSAAEDVFQAQEVMGTLEAGAAEKPQKKPAVLGISKYASMLPEKVS